MVMMIEPVERCLEHLFAERTYDEVIFMTPDGQLLDQPLANQLSVKKNLILPDHNEPCRRAVDTLCQPRVIPAPIVNPIYPVGHKRVALRAKKRIHIDTSPPQRLNRDALHCVTGRFSSLKYSPRPHLVNVWICWGFRSKEARFCEGNN